MYFNIDDFIEFSADKPDQVKIKQPLVFQKIRRSNFILIGRNPLIHMRDFLGDIPRTEVYFQKSRLEVHEYGVTDNKVIGRSLAGPDMEGYLTYYGFTKEMNWITQNYKSALIYIPHVYRSRYED